VHPWTYQKNRRVKRLIIILLLVCPYTQYAKAQEGHLLESSSAIYSSLVSDGYAVKSYYVEEYRVIEAFKECCWRKYYFKNDLCFMYSAKVYGSSHLSWRESLLKRGYNSVGNGEFLRGSCGALIEYSKGEYEVTFMYLGG
jgi:hypothetical protein